MMLLMMMMMMYKFVLFTVPTLSPLIISTSSIYGTDAKSDAIIEARCERAHVKKGVPVGIAPHRRKMCP